MSTTNSCDVRFESCAAEWLGPAAIVGCTVVLLVFAIFPEVDLAVARYFYLGGGKFFGEGGSIAILREVFKSIFIAVAGACILGLLLTHRTEVRFLGLTKAKWLFLALAISVGPGLVANVVMKDNWGRARPNQLVEFGGDRAFTPPQVPADQCQKNCSFVCGEASSIFAMFFAAGIVFRRWSFIMLACGLGVGGFAGLVRITQGGHFVSDVLFSAVFMALVVWALDMAFRMHAKARAAPRAAAAQLVEAV